MKQFVAYAIIVFVAMALITGIIEPISEDAWYTLAGLGLFTFGIWASVLLLRGDKPKCTCSKDNK